MGEEAEFLICLKQTQLMELERLNVDIEALPDTQTIHSVIAAHRMQWFC